MAAMAALSYGIQSLVGKDIINYHMNELRDDMKKPHMGQEAPEVASAYLGPKLWENPISLPFELDSFGMNDIQDVLVENDIKVDYSAGSPEAEGRRMEDFGMADSPASSPEEGRYEPAHRPPPAHAHRPSIFASVGQEGRVERPAIISGPPGEETVEVKRENSFLYIESKRAKADREREERRQQMELDFTAEDLALATVPGYNFDPRQRSFHLDELRPQPIIKKRKMMAVPEEQKDEKYWEKRLKNKEATRRSREAKRLKQNQIALRAAHLERENRSLKDQVELARRSSSRLQEEAEELRVRLERWEQHQF